MRSGDGRSVCPEQQYVAVQEAGCSPISRNIEPVRKRREEGLPEKLRQVGQCVEAHAVSVSIYEEAVLDI